MKNRIIDVGISIGDLLACAFIVLKWCNVIKWRWWWVLSPIWIPWVIVTISTIVIALCDKKS